MSKSLKEQLLAAGLVKQKQVHQVEKEKHKQARQQPKPKVAKTPAAPAKPQNTKVADVADPALQGWRARSCEAKVADGIVRLTKVGEASFLGFSAARHSGPSTVTFRIKAQPGHARVDWLSGGVASPAQSVSYEVKSSDWQEIAVKLPATSSLGIVRLYLPKQDGLVELDWIEITSEIGEKTRTAF